MEIMEIRAEKVTPYAGDPRSKTAQVGEMFDHIAPAYDFMNRAMTLGIDRRWRARAVRRVAAARPAQILDVATGTADFAISLARECPEARVTGIDLSEGMMAVGREKVAALGLADRISLRQADCLSLPFADGSFDAVTVAFGVRNFEHLERGYSEMARVLRPGGVLCVLELSVPPSALVRPFYRAYTRWLIPLAGRVVSADPGAYSYLPASIAAMPQGRDMLALMSRAGLRDPSLRRLTLGVCTLYTAAKP